MLRTALASLAMLVAACAGSTTGASPETSGQPSVRRLANLITEDELAQSSYRDAHHAISSLRPDWLRSRGRSSMQAETTQAIVYLNGQRYGGLNSLAQLRIASIKEMRYLSATEATHRFGGGHNSGAILVTMK